MSISSVIYEKAGTVFNKVAKSNFMTKRLDKGVSDPARFAAAMLVTSIVSKDLIGCVLYTTQSWNNKKIPEDKRKFVAAVDLMNGIVMVGGQFLIGKIIDAKFTPWLTSKFTGTIKDKFTDKEVSVDSNKVFHTDKIRQLVVDTAKEKNINVKNIEEVVSKVAKKCKSPFVNGFGILVAAIATTALTKRTLAPLISTPMAGWLNDKFLNKKKNPDNTLNPVDISPKFNNKMEKDSFNKSVSK